MLHPAHLIGSLERLRNSFALCHLRHKTVKHGVRLPINIGEIGVQPAARFHLQVERATVLLDISQVPLASDADGRRFLCGQAREIVVSPALIPQAVSFFVDVLFHVNPPIK